MRDFEIEQVSLNLRWDYEILVQSLPDVGTDAFKILCKKLAPFGLDASRIILEAPTNKPGDTQLTMILLNGRLGIRFTISYFEIISDNFMEGDQQNIIDIAEIVFEAIDKIDEDARTGKANIRLAYHLELESKENLKLLSEHLNLSNNVEEIWPLRAAYNIDLTDNQNLQDATVALANSLIYRDSIFFEVNLTYLRLENIQKFVNSVTNDVVRIFNLLGLNGKTLLN